MPKVLPSSDLGTTGWTAVPPGSVFSTLDEASADDADYAWSPLLSASTLKLGLGAVVPPGQHTVRIRAWTTSGPSQIRVKLLNDSDVSQGVSDSGSVSTTPTTLSFPITTTGNSTRLWIEVNVGEVGGQLYFGNDMLYMDDLQVSLV